MCFWLISTDIENRDSSLTFGSWRPLPAGFGVGQATTMDVVVENLGRANYGQPHNFQQKKGLWEGPLILDGKPLSDFQIIPLEFNTPWVRALNGWKSYSSQLADGPKAFRFQFNVINPLDTYVDMTEWGKGVVFVNGFNLGRYWSYGGPQRTLYLPAPLLKEGINEVCNFYKITSGIKVRIVCVNSYVIRPIPISNKIFINYLFFLVFANIILDNCLRAVHSSIQFEIQYLSKIGTKNLNKPFLITGTCSVENSSNYRFIKI